MRKLRGSRNCRKVILGNSTSVKVNSVGTVDLEVNIGGRKSIITLDNVLFVPELRVNLISVTCLMKDKIDLLFDSEEGLCKLMRGEEEIAQAHKRGRLWALTLFQEGQEEAPVQRQPQKPIQLQEGRGLTCGTFGSIT